MKRFAFSLIISLISFCAIAQTASVADFTKCVAKYRNHAGVSAIAVKTNHKAAVANDEITYGDMYIAAPDKICITFNDCTDQLIMNAGVFTMTVNGKRHITNSSADAQFATFQAVLESVICGGTKTDFASLDNVKMEKSGSDVVITITPKQESPAADGAAKGAKKKGGSRIGKMFSSFVITVNAGTPGLKSLRMNGRGSNYTEYTFTDTNLGTQADPKFFK